MTPDKILLEICQEKDIITTSFCDNYVLKLAKNGQNHYLIGRHLGLNSAVSAALANDKSATFAILSSKNIPAVPHYLYKNPALFPDYKNPSLSRQSFPLVLKPNSNTHGGQDVSLINTPAQATACIKNLFKVYDSLALSPFIDYPHEYRCFVLDGQVYLIYKKSRAANDFRFNLSRGATARLIPEKDKLYASLSALAIAAASALDLRYASVDILDGKVLELHSAPAARKLLRQLPTAAPLLRNFYRAALEQLFS
ncbi:hypothetical protein IJH97_00645 [Candidatus Saccharibacteria bacterium]|nr:hypothetical protein [Candidatus Saccharibacteria bacterium]